MSLEQTVLHLGLAVPLVVALCLARGVDAAGRVSPLPLALGLAVPPLLLLVPFFGSTTSGRGDLGGLQVRLTYVVVAVLGLSFAALAGRLHAQETRRRPGRRLAPLSALLVSLSAIHAFGLFVLTRQSIAIDPGGGIADAVLEEPKAYLLRLVAPTVAMASVVVMTSGVPWVVDRVTVVRLRSRARGAVPGDDAGRQRVAVVVGMVAVLLVALPRFAGSAENAAYLSVRVPVLGSVRTPELGLYLLILALALLGASDRTSPRRTRAVDLRGLATPSGRRQAALVGLALGASVARSDLGAVVSLVAAYVAIRIVVYRGIDGDRLLGAGMTPGPRSHPVWRYRRTWAPGVLVALVLVVVASAAVGKADRFETWLDPWRVPLAAPVQECVPVTDEPVADLRPAVDVPDGVEACLLYAVDEPEVGSSQAARSQVVTEAGGLIGQGIDDTTSRIVPVAESDFVIAAIWSKAGGLSVLLLLALFCVAGGALARYVERRDGPWLARRAHDRVTVLTAAGVGAVLLWQPVYVVAANLGLLPHSGVPVPLVSEGLWSAASLVAAIGGVLVLAHWTADDDTGAAPRPVPPRVGVTARIPASSLTAFGLACGLVVWGLAFPLSALVSSESYLPDLDRGWDVPGVQGLLADGEPDQVLIEGEPALERRTVAWEALDGGPDPELVQEFLTAYGNGEGFADDAVAALGPVPRRGFLDRLRPPRPRPGREVELTVDLGWQRLVRDLVREPVDGTRFATGVSVVRADSGAIAALGSAPELSDATDESLTSSVEALNLGEAERVGDGSYRSLATGVERCRGDDCVRVMWRLDPARRWEVGTLASYVGLPHTDGTLRQNRATAQVGAGSTFKVVIASAYLRAGGHLSDLVDAPTSMWVDGRSITNVYPGGRCPLTSGGRQSIAQALATSCNTPMVALAQRLGWDAVAEEAELLGLSVTGRPTARCALPGLSSVPAGTGDSGIANLALGGGDLTVSPMVMAMVMGTIAADGVRVQPHAVTTNGEPCRVRAMSASAAAELRAALRLAATDGSLVGVEVPGSPALHGKTGTHVLSARDGTGGVDRVVWITGFVDSESGPVAFAVATQSVGTEPGRAHVRSLVGRLIEGAGP